MRRAACCAASSRSKNGSRCRSSVNGVGAHFALNDVVVRRGAQARMAPFGLSLDGELIAHIPSDGIVVATPTGSTAYFLSAGGPIISPTVDAFGVAALLPHTLFARPLIVPTSSTIDITLRFGDRARQPRSRRHARGRSFLGRRGDDRARAAAGEVRAHRRSRVLRPPRRKAAMGRSDQARHDSAAAADDRQRRLDRARRRGVRRGFHGLHRRDRFGQDDAARRARCRARRPRRARSRARRTRARRARTRGDGGAARAARRRWASSSPPTTTW